MALQFLEISDLEVGLKLLGKKQQNRVMIMFESER